MTTATAQSGTKSSETLNIETQGISHAPAAVLLPEEQGILVDSSLKVESPALTVQQQGNVRFVTGGSGTQERTQLESVGHSYNTHLVSANTAGASLGTTHYIVYDATGKEVLAADAGPLLYTQLTPGLYDVVATLGGTQQRKKMNVSSSGSAELQFLWK